MIISLPSCFHWKACFISTDTVQCWKLKVKQSSQKLEEEKNLQKVCCFKNVNKADYKEAHQDFCTVMLNIILALQISNKNIFQYFISIDAASVFRNAVVLCRFVLLLYTVSARWGLQTQRNYCNPTWCDKSAHPFFSSSSSLLCTYSVISKFRIWCSRSAWFGFRLHVCRLRPVLILANWSFCFCACRPADEQAIASPDRGLLHVWCSAGCSPERALLSTPALQVALGEHHGLLLAQGVFVWKGLGGSYLWMTHNNAETQMVCLTLRFFQ